MTDDALFRSLRDILEQHSEKVSKPAAAVLFRRGDSAKGMFVVLSGKVNLDGTGDTVRSYGPGEVVGLLSTLTGNKYGVTATVSEEAELGFWSPEALDSLLRERPDLCRPLLAILGVRLAEDEDAESVSPPSRLSQPRNSKLI